MRREICSGSHRRPSALLRKTMLGAAAPLVLAALLAPSASLADGGAGGAGDLGRVLGGLVPLGGLGGGDGQSGGDGVDGHTVIVTGSGAGGGGGGGGAGGGLGGAGGPGAPQPLFPTLFGGAGGTGGDGGNNGLTAVQVNIGAPITGGAGRRGGDGLAGTDDGGGGGGGGSGGNALVIVSSSANSSIGTIRGGVGGIGGSGGGAAAGGGNGGSGGDGGAAVSLIGVSASFINGGTLQGGNGGSGGVGGIGGSIGHGGSGGTGGAGISMPFIATLVNNGSITGGNGALAGSEQSANAALGSGPGHNGGGGVGIIGAGATVINAGIISGGLSANGLTRANAITFNGGTNSLTLQAGSSITGNVLAFSSADTLALGGSANANFDASAIGSQYLGFGNFQKTGTSTWTLAGIDAAARSWSVDAGTLSVNATVNGAVMTVNSGGTLSGTGSIGGATVRSGGTFMPGSGTAGTSITVGGNLAFQSGAIYLAQINPTTASLTNVTGTAALAGTVQAAFAPGSYVSRQYHLLHASALSGSFGSLGTTNLPVGFSGSLSYTATDVVLDLAVRVATSGSITNQDAVSTAISTFFNGGGALPPGFVTLLGLSGGNLANALGQLSGEPATGAQQATFNGMTMFMGILTDPTIEGRGGGSGSAGAMPFAQTGQDSAAAYAEARGKRNGSETDSYAMFSNAPMRQGYDPRWSVWSVAFGGSQTTEGNVAAGSNATSSRLFGVAAGADVLLSPRTIAGFAMAGGGTNFSVANSLGSGRSDLFQAGVFVRHTAGAAYISGALGYGWQDVTTNRTVLVAGVDRLRAQFNANAYSARFESGYRVVAPWTGMGITPYAAAQFTMFDLPAYAEQMVLGSGSFALGYGSRRVADSRTELGLRADKSVALSDSVLTVRSALGWAHQYNTDRNVAATFQALPGSSFVVNGASAARNSALTTASAEVKWMNGWSTIATFQGEFSGISESYAGKGVARFQW